MTCAIKWSPIALKELRKLDHSVSERIVRKITVEVVPRPETFIESLVGEDFFKIRVGDYRLFVDFSRNPDILVVRSIRHRSVAYLK